MSLALFQNADLVTQPNGSVVRWSESGNLCNLASGSGVAPLTSVLGTRLSDVAPAESAVIGPITTGSVIKLAQTMSVGQVVWLAGDGSGLGTPVASAYRLGICYSTFEVSGQPYCQIVVPHLWQEIPYDLSCFVAGQASGTGVLVFAHKTARAFNVFDIVGVLAAAAPADAVWTLNVNGVSAAELHWTSGSTALTLVFTPPAGGYAISAGATVSLVTTSGTTQPSDVAVTLKGELP